MRNNGKRNEGLAKAGKGGQGSRPPAQRFPKPQAVRSIRTGVTSQPRAQAGVSRRPAAVAKRAPKAGESTVRAGALPLPGRMAFQVRRVGGRYVIHAAGLQPQFELQASSDTFAGVLAELESAVAAALEVAR